MEAESGNNSGGANPSDVNNIIQYFQDINITQPISESKLKIILKEVQVKQQQHPELVTTSKLHEYVRDLLIKCSPPSSESDAKTLLTEPETSNALQFLKVISEDTKISPLLCPPEILVLFAKSIFPQVTTLICNSETTSTSLASSQKCSSLLHKTVRVSLNLVKAITSPLSKQLSQNLDDDASNSKSGVNPWLSLQEFGIEFLNLLSSHPTAALDIKSNAGLVVSHLARRKFLDQLLSSTANGTCSVSSSEFVSINNGNLFEKAVRKFVSLDHVNKVAMCFGALGTRQDLTTEFMVIIANCVLLEEQSNSTKEAVNLGAARVLEIWMEKLNIMFPSSQLHELSSVLSLMEIFIFTYLAGHIDAVKNCCRNMLSNLSVAYTSLDDGDEDSPLLTDLLVKILAKPYHVKWVSLASVTRTNPQSVLLLRLWKDPAENLLCAQRTFKNAAADVYLSLMKYTFKTYDSSLWVKTWITPLLETQIDQDNESNWTQKKIILSKAMSFKEREIQQCILSTVVATMRSTSESFSSLSIESCLLIVECLKIGTELGVPIDQNEIGSAPPPPTLLDSGSSSGSVDDKKITNTLFRGVLPRDIFNSWAFHANPQIRLATFSILVDTKKTSEVFNEADFEAIKVLFRYSLVNQSPAFRQQFMSYFKKLMRRLKDGRSSCKRLRRNEDFENYNDFIKWMWTFFTREGLFAGANFSRRYQSLDCIVELLEHFPVESLTENLTENESLSFIRWLGDTYENNKISAVEILSRIKIPAFEDDAFCEHILQTATTLLTSVKPPDSVTSRYLLLLLLKASRSYYPWNFLRMLLTKLERIVESLKRKKCTLLEVSSTTPPYGIIRAIRLIFVTYKSEIIYDTCNLKKNPTKSLKSGSHPLTFDLLQDYSRRLLTACFDLDDILFPVLGDAAPEGFLPDLNENDKILPESSKIVRSINAQMLLVSSWRSMKEICILLTELCVHFPLEGELDGESSSKKDGGGSKPGNRRFMLQFEEVRDIGNHLVYLLMNLMHRGVFEQVFVGFKSLAVRLKKSTSLKLNKLSEEWLEDIMGNVKDKCTTRRSAGLPFIFQAILTPETGNEFKITYWMKKLLELDPEQKSIAVVRIHSMNVLRALFRDANFSRAIMSWVPDGIQLAFIGLRAKEWAEQNSGLMLYGSVIRRTFGPNLNLMSAPTFFRKFPQMYDFLLGEIKGTAGDITKSWNSSASDEGNYKITQKEDDFAYHVLLLFSCFSSAPGKLEEGNYRLSAFIPYIQACGASRDVQVRTMAAKALVPFITSPVDRQKVLENSLENLIFHSKVIRSNRIHGDLLQLVAIVHLIQSYEEEIGTSLIEKFQIIIDIAKNVKSPSIFEAFANLAIALARFNQKNLMSTAFTMQRLNQESFEALYSSSKYTRRNCVPGLPDADEAVSKSAVTFECSSEGEISVSGWIEAGNPCVVEQLLVTLLEAVAQTQTDSNKKEKEGKNNKSSSIPAYSNNKDFRISKENNVKLLQRYINENFNFQGQTDYECRYLTYFASNQFDVLEQLNSLMSEELIKLAVEKLILVCESDFGTVDCKAAALRVLAKFVFNSQMCVSKVVQFKDALCDLILEWTDSKFADELRLAAAESLPKLPLRDEFTCSDLQFCKLWSAAFILAQDDEIFIRQEAFKKLSEAGDIPGCSLKCLELLVEAFFDEITKRHTIVGFWALLALILKDDFDVIATGADDEDEDRLFERSEMNMFAETVTLTKLIVDHLTRNQNITEFLKVTLDVPANIEHLNIFNQISHLNFDFKISGSESVVPTNTVVFKLVLNSNAEDNSNMDWEVNIDKSNIEDVLRGHEKEVVQQFIRRKMHNLFF